MSESTEGMVKIFFEPPGGEEDWHTTVESMWATPVEKPNAPGGRVFKLDNSPWYAFGVSLDDEVCAELRHESMGEGNAAFECETLYFTKVWNHSGHSTYTLFLQNGLTTESPEWSDRWTDFKAMGCSWEGMNSNLLSVDVPPGTDLDRLEELFESALAAGIFAYQTQHRFSPTN
jgi:hypothetical protein